MHPTVEPQRDPLRWCIAITLAFMALAAHRLGIPSKLYFDEVHYIPAARLMLDLASNNPEHPLLGKQIFAAAIWLWGDQPLAWRVPALLFGTIGLFAFGRLMWWASLRRLATLLGMGLLATNFGWFIHSRIAMLDIIMAGLVMIALWQFAAAVRRPAQGRWRLALTGLFLGLAMGTKWNAVAAAVLPGLAFLALKLKHNAKRFLTAREGGPVPGITLVEAALWLGLFPLAVYWATYMPAFFYAKDAVDPLAPLKHHAWMIELQASVKKPHPYSSFWYHWIGNWRAIWYLYEIVDGAQRGIVLLGNPFSMLAGLPAVLWALWAGFRRQRGDALALALLYLACVGMWVGNAKPIQFYYHYLLPGAFLMGCLALALDEWHEKVEWLLPWVAAGFAALAFIHFYPIISGARLSDGPRAFEYWMWLQSWR